MAKQINKYNGFNKFPVTGYYLSFKDMEELKARAKALEDENEKLKNQVRFKDGQIRNLKRKLGEQL